MPRVGMNPQAFYRLESVEVRCVKSKLVKGKPRDRPLLLLKLSVQDVSDIAVLRQHSYVYSYNLHRKNVGLLLSTCF